MANRNILTVSLIALRATWELPPPSLVQRWRDTWNC